MHRLVSRSTPELVYNRPRDALFYRLSWINNLSDLNMSFLSILCYIWVIQDDNPYSDVILRFRCLVRM